MPERRAADDLFPRPDAGERCVHDDEASHAIGILRCKRIADHVADIVGDEIGLRELQLVENARDVAGFRLLVVSALGVRRETHAAQVGHHDGVVVPERCRQRPPHVTGVAKAVQHHDRRPLAANANMDCRALRLDLFGVEAGWEWHNLRAGRWCDGEQAEHGKARHGGGAPRDEKVPVQ